MHPVHSEVKVSDADRRMGFIYNFDESDQMEFL